MAYIKTFGVGGNMKKIMCIITAIVIAVGNVTFLERSASAEGDTATAVGEAYLQVLKQNCDYLNSANYKGSTEYINDFFVEWFTTDRSEQKYALCDIAGDGVPELMLAVVVDPDKNQYGPYEFYGFENGKLKSLADSIGVRNRYYITENNLVRQEWANGAADCGTIYYSLAPNSATLKKEMAYVADTDRYVLRKKRNRNGNFL